jgi:hypothetical protein
MNIDREFEQVTEYWSPRVVADANGQLVKIAKAKGEFVWHSHAEEDEFFLVRKGTLLIRYRDRPDVTLREGDFHVVPRGAHDGRSRGMLGDLHRARADLAHGRYRHGQEKIDRGADGPSAPVGRLSDQPPVTLIWRATAGRLRRRSMTKSCPLGLREIASSIASSTASLASERRSGARRSAASSWPRHM